VIILLAESGHKNTVFSPFSTVSVWQPYSIHRDSGSPTANRKRRNRPKIGQKVIFFENFQKMVFCSVFYGDSFCSWNRVKKTPIFPIF
jgi:hypothetical protein